MIGLIAKEKPTQADVAQLVECVPSKYEVAGSNPVIRSKINIVISNSFLKLEDIYMYGNKSM